MTTGHYHNIFRDPRYARAHVKMSRGGGADPVNLVASTWVLQKPRPQRYSLTAGYGTLAFTGEDANLYQGYPSAWGYAGRLGPIGFRHSMMTHGGTSRLTQVWRSWQFGRYRIYVKPAVMVLTGDDVALDRVRTLSIDAAVLAFTGFDVAFDRVRSITIGVGAAAVTGLDVGFLRIRTLSASAGAFVATSIDVGMLKGWLLQPTVAAFAIVGEANLYTLQERIYRITAENRGITINPEHRGVVISTASEDPAP